MKYLITGGAGFLGSNLSKKVLENDKELIIFDNLSRSDSEKNVDWLRTFGDFTLVRGDIRNNNDVEEAVRNYTPDIIFHIAGQVAMTTSILDPIKDFETNAVGTVNVLESMRRFSDQSILIYSSTNKVYGDLNYLTYREEKTRYVCKEFPDGFSENIPLDFKTPYGVSKGTADQYVSEYSRTFNLKTVVFRHSSIYGIRQFATIDQGWVGWFIQRVVAAMRSGVKQIDLGVSGNGKQVRDLLYVDDAVNLYFQTAANVNKAIGNAFNIGGGFINSFSLLELFSFLEEDLDIKINVQKLPVRQSDQKVFIADTKKIRSLINWTPRVTKEAGIREMTKWVCSTYKQ